uniref:Uncharacterized protein n=1 Tax=Cacopsylla melanoneura TaxID=428564 RepID=A0A8D8LLB6_9HEMI
MLRSERWKTAQSNSMMKKDNKGLIPVPFCSPFYMKGPQQNRVQGYVVAVRSEKKLQRVSFFKSFIVHSKDIARNTAGSFSYSHPCAVSRKHYYLTAWRGVYLGQ